MIALKENNVGYNCLLSHHLQYDKQDKLYVQDIIPV